MRTTMSFSLSMVLAGTLALTLGGCGGGGGGGDAGSEPMVATGESTYQLTPSPNATYPYRVTVLALEGKDSWGVALNDQGQLAGNYHDASGAVHAFLWQEGSLYTVERSQATALNDNGVMAGWLDSEQGPVPFRYNGHLEPVASGGVGGKAYGIDAAGRCAGLQLGAAGEHSPWLEGQELSEAAQGHVAALSSNGRAVFQQFEGEAGRALLLEGGKLTELGDLGGNSTVAKDINDRGEVVGWSLTAGGSYHAFLWRDGKLLDLGDGLGADFSSAVAINDLGQVLLSVSDTSGERMLLWEEGETSDLDYFGAGYAEAYDLNNNGQITGWLTTDQGELRAFIATPR